jgi:phosphate transport system substrate-binding protein
LPLNLVQAGFQQLAKLKQADPNVDLTNRDVTKCNNPTFVPGNLAKNHLAEIAPMPASCDKLGAGPCGTDTGNNQPSTDGNSQPSTSTGPAQTNTGGTTTGSTTTTGGTTNGPAPPGGTTGTGGQPTGTSQQVVDPNTGAVTSTQADGSSQAIYANPTVLVADRTSDDRAFGWLAALELLALVLVPGIYVVTRGRRPRGDGR